MARRCSLVLSVAFGVLILARPVRAEQQQPPAQPSSRGMMIAGLGLTVTAGTIAAVAYPYIGLGDCDDFCNPKVALYLMAPFASALAVAGVPLLMVGAADRGRTNLPAVHGGIALTTVGAVALLVSAPAIMAGADAHRPLGGTDEKVWVGIGFAIGGAAAVAGGLLLYFSDWKAPSRRPRRPTGRSAGLSWLSITAGPRPRDAPASLTLPGRGVAQPAVAIAPTVIPTTQGARYGLSVVGRF